MQFGAVIEFFAIGGLEQQTAKADGLHQQPVARFEGDRIDMARIGQMHASWRFALREFGVIAQGR